MSNRIIWVSLRRLKAQEFRKTMRHLQNTGLSWSDAYLRLGELYSDSLKRFAKQNLAIFSIYLGVTSLSEGRNVELKLGNIAASLPIEYVAFIASLYIFYSVSQLQTSATLLQIKVAAGQKLKLRGFSPDHFAFYHGQDHNSLTTPVIMSSFLQDKYGFSRALLIIMLIIMTLSTFPIFLILVYFLKLQAELVTSSQLLSFEAFIASLGLLSLVLSLVYLVLFNVPISLYRNSISIRWGFLYQIGLTENNPQLETWLRKDTNR